MAFVGNFTCTSFKLALLDGTMDFSADTSQTYKIALYTSSATLNADTTAYTTTNEVSGAGYTAGDGGSGTTTACKAEGNAGGASDATVYFVGGSGGGAGAVGNAQPDGGSAVSGS